MSLVPFETPRPEDQLPDPFEERDGGSSASLVPVGNGAAGAEHEAGAEAMTPVEGAGPRPWAVPHPADSPGESGRRLPLPLEGDRVLPFRRRQQRVPIRRRTPWRRWLRPLLGALAIVASPVVLVVWFLTSSHFALDRWQVTTGERIEHSWVAAQLSAFEGRNLFELDLRQVEKRLAHPWLAGVDLRKEFPSRLVVRVIERREVALWRGVGGLSYVDDQGRVIAPFSTEEAPAGGVDLVLASRRRGPEDVVDETTDAERRREIASRDAAARRSAVALLREIEELDTQLLGGLAEIRVLSQEDFEIFTSDLPFPLLVRAGTLETKTRRLEEILPGLMARHIVPSVVDLRFRRRIIVEPSPEPVQSTGAVERNR